MGNRVNCLATISTENYTRMLSTLVSRIKRGYHNTYIFAVSEDELIVCSDSKKNRIEQLEGQATLIGVYSATGVTREALESEISFVIDA